MWLDLNYVIAAKQQLQIKGDRGSAYHSPYSRWLSASQIGSRRSEAADRKLFGITCINWYFFFFFASIWLGQCRAQLWHPVFAHSRLPQTSDEEMIQTKFVAGDQTEPHASTNPESDLRGPSYTRPNMNHFLKDFVRKCFKKMLGNVWKC